MSESKSDALDQLGEEGINSESYFLHGIVRPSVMLRLCPYLQDANTTILHSKILEGLHGVKLSAYARLTSVLRQLFPLTTLFLPLLDRLTFASSPTSYVVKTTHPHGSVSVYSSY